MSRHVLIRGEGGEVILPEARIPLEQEDASALLSKSERRHAPDGPGANNRDVGTPRPGHSWQLGQVHEESIWKARGYLRKLGEM